MKYVICEQLKAEIGIALLALVSLVMQNALKSSNGTYTGCHGKNITGITWNAVSNMGMQPPRINETPSFYIELLIL